MKSHPALLPNGLSASTIGMLHRAELPPVQRALLTNPAEVEQRLTPELITTFAEANFTHGWKARQHLSGEAHPDAAREYDDLPPHTIDFTRHLASGKLSYYLAFITREGLVAMRELGEKNLSLSEIKLDAKDERFRFFAAADSGESVQDTLARLERENWLNQNAVLRRVHQWNYEWNACPPGREFGDGLSRIQADMDCCALAALSEEAFAHFLSLSAPGDGRQFFHQDRFLHVRNGIPVQPLDAGQRFRGEFDIQQLSEIFERLSLSKAADHFFEIHGVLDGYKVPARERAIIRETLYCNDGFRIDDQERRVLLDVVAELAREKISIGLLDVASVVALINERAKRCPSQSNADVLTLDAGSLASVSWNPVRQYPDIQQRLETILTLIAEQTVARERIVTEPAFAYSDSLNCHPFDPHFLNLTTRLRAIFDERKLHSDYLSIAVQTLPPVAVERIQLRETTQYRQEIEQALGEIQLTTLGAFERRYQRALIDLQIFLERQPKLPYSGPRTELASNVSFRRYEDQVLAMIKATSSNYGTAEFREKGGLLFNYYDQAFFNDFLAVGNHLLLHHLRAKKQDRDLDGVFLYLPPENSSDDAQFPRPEAVKTKKVSIAELFVTTHDRASGTIYRLFRGMSCRLQLYGADFSLGIVNTENERQKRVLEHLGHALLPIGEIRSPWRNGIMVSYWPALCPIHPGLVRAWAANSPFKKPPSEKTIP